MFNRFILEELTECNESNGITSYICSSLQPPPGRVFISFSVHAFSILKLMKFSLHFCSARTHTIHFSSTHHSTLDSQSSRNFFTLRINEPQHNRSNSKSRRKQAYQWVFCCFNKWFGMMITFFFDQLRWDYVAELIA